MSPWEINLRLMGGDASRNWEWGTSRRKAEAGMEEETHSGVVGGPTFLLGGLR